jgi:hypothetical protein
MWWTVKVRDAKRDIKINGSLKHALKSTAGVTIGCTMSNMTADKENAAAIPHAVFLAVFTKNTAILIDSLDAKGAPRTGFLYQHSYGELVDCNDTRQIKRMVADDPALIEREFVLRVPRKKVISSGHNSGRKENPRQVPHNFVPRGALRRAVKAGLIGKHVAEQLALTLR